MTGAESRELFVFSLLRCFRCFLSSLTLCTFTFSTYSHLTSNSYNIHRTNSRINKLINSEEFTVSLYKAPPIFTSSLYGLTQTLQGLHTYWKGFRRGCVLRFPWVVL